MYNATMCSLIHLMMVKYLDTLNHCMKMTLSDFTPRPSSSLPGASSYDYSFIDESLYLWTQSSSTSVNKIIILNLNGIFGLLHTRGILYSIADEIRFCLKTCQLFYRSTL